MKTLTPLCLSLMAGSAAAQFPPGQPLCSYWFPDEILAWDPATDPDAPYNVSSVPLAPRIPYGIQVNSHARPGEAQISTLCAWYGTSSNPSQGRENFDVFAPNYWMYIDIMVFWGGSAGEGLILAPAPYVTDAAHRNGVPVYGTVFFPPTAYGGQIEWVWDLVQEEGGVFPVADKLIEAAEYYGFDGWFINQETAGGNAQLALQVRDFMDYVQTNSDIDVMWYDAMIENGAIAWQNALNANNDMFFHDGGVISDEFFINFNWNQTGLVNSGTLAESYGRSRYDLFAGADVEASGYNTSVNWAVLFPEGEAHRTSLGFYRPEWCFNSSTGPADFYQKENRFWVGANRDPSNTATSHPWKGMAHYVPDRSVIGSCPFVTNFSTGQGGIYAIDGLVERTGDWSNLSLQDILPTWRWISTSAGTPLHPDLVWDDAYYGGTCLSVSGDLVAGTPADLMLFGTDVAISSSTSCVIAFRADAAGQPSRIQIALDLDDTSGAGAFIDVGNSTQAGWNLKTVSLSSYSGHTLEALGLRFVSSTSISGFDARIGRLGLLDGPPDPPAPPSGLWVDGFYQTDDDHASVRLRWTRSPDEVYQYNVYRLDDSGSRTFLWGTPDNACFVPELVREAGETETTLFVEAVGPDFHAAGADSVLVTWTITGIEGSPPVARPTLDNPTPNPSSLPLNLSFFLPSAGMARLAVYGLDGRLVETLYDGDAAEGLNGLRWTADEVPAGIYFLRLDCPSGSVVRSLVRL
mgnify:FL=1